MSDPGPIDLADLQLKPQWVDELDQPNRFETFEGKEPRGRGRDRDRGPGGDRRPGGGPRGPRDRRGGPGGGGDGRQRRPQGEGRRQGPGGQGKFGDRRSGGGGQRRDRDHRGPRQGDGDRRRPDRPPLYELVDIELKPDSTGLEAVAKQIKMTGRAYPVFDLARLVLGGPERYHATFILKPETTQVELIVCKPDQSLWLSKGEAMRHVRASSLFDDYYKKEEVEVDPPKGNFNVVAVCGLSGALLGPPNFHAYQKNVADLHHRRFSRMHIDGYKRRIEMVRDEETIEKWKSTLTKETHYTYLKAAEGEEAPVFKSLGEAERHFSEHHYDEVFESVKSVTVPGTLTQKQLSGALHHMLQRAAERQTRFPMPMVKNISPHLEKAGLRFFKIGRKETFVARSRPRALNPKTEVSPRIRSIVQYIRDNEKQDLNKLVTALVPNASSQDGKEPTPEEIEFLKDLRWLIREGFVIEFSNGELRLGSAKGTLPPASKSKGAEGKPAEGKAKSKSKSKSRARRRGRRSRVRTLGHRRPGSVADRLGRRVQELKNRRRKDRRQRQLGLQADGLAFREAGERRRLGRGSSVRKRSDRRPGLGL